MKRSLFCFTVAAVFAAHAFGFIPVIVVPNADLSVPGGDNSGTLPTSPTSIEFQAVLAASQFPVGTIFITGLNWRAAPGTGAVTGTVSGTISLAYSANQPGAMSTVFANNYATPATPVLTATNLSLVDPGCVAGPTPCSFGSNFAFTTPFAYNPANGPLLVDTKITSFVSTGTGEFDVADCGSPCVANSVFASPLGATSGGLNNSFNVSQLIFTRSLPSTPVPPSILLTLAGLACLGLYASRFAPKLG